MVPNLKILALCVVPLEIQCFGYIIYILILCFRVNSRHPLAFSLDQTFIRNLFWTSIVRPFIVFYFIFFFCCGCLWYWYWFTSECISLVFALFPSDFHPVTLTLCSLSCCPIICQRYPINLLILISW